MMEGSKLHPPGQDAAYTLLGGTSIDDSLARKRAQSARVASLSRKLAQHQATTRESHSPTSKADPYVKGARVFLRHAEQGWILGTVHRAHLTGRSSGRLYSILPGEPEVDADGAELVLSAARAKELVRLTRDDFILAAPTSADRVKDLMQIPQLHESVILHQLRETYEGGEIHLDLGPNTCIAINPGRPLPDVISPEVFRKYVDARGTQHESLPPHVWGTAHKMFWQTLRQSPVESNAQAMVFTGVSGSGKTESMNLSLHYLLTASAEQANAGHSRAQCERLGAKILTASKVLDVFGNASIHRFPNSTRMTKLIELFVTNGGALRGARFKVYMLERSRVTSPPEGERAFHAFYALLAGIDPNNRRRLGFDNPRTYEWLFRSLVVTDEDEAQDSASYNETRAVLTELGLAAFELDAIDSILAGIIHLRSVEMTTPSAVRRNNVEWTEEKEETVRIAAALWGVEPHALFGEVASVTTAGRAGVQTRRLRPVQADIARNNVCKAVYCALTRWLVNRINQVLYEPIASDVVDTGRPKLISMCLLDVFGTENDKKRGNMLEQLLINTANEEMQQLYNRYVFEDEVAECLHEGLDMGGHVPPDTSHTIRLMAGQPKGLFALLDDNSKQNGGQGVDHAFISQLGLHHKDHPSLDFDVNGVFGVNHYFGVVRYGPTALWSTLNMDICRDTLVEMFEDSTNDIVRQTFYISRDDGTSLVKGTLCAQYLASTSELIRILSGRHVSWCRCVRPSHSGIGFAGTYVLSQLQHDGVVETIKVKRSCYPIRLPHDYFVGRYKTVVCGSSYDHGDGSVTAVEILKFANLDDLQESQMGTTKVFLKDSAHNRLEELRRDMTSPSRLVTGFIAAKLSQKASKARSAAGSEDSPGSRPASPKAKPKPRMSMFAAQQSMRVLATHLPVFLAFARGALAVNLVRELKRPDVEDTLSQSDHHSEGGSVGVQQSCSSVSESASYLEKGVLATSAPLRKLAEWKRNSQRAAQERTPLEPPPAPVNLEGDDPTRHPDDISGRLCKSRAYQLPAPDLDQGDNDFHEPGVENHDYQSIILKEAGALNRMSAEELFECLGQGRREVRASLRLSKEAVQAIKRIIAQGSLHERHCQRERLNREKEDRDRAEREGTGVGIRKHDENGFPNTLGPLALSQCGGVVTQVKDGRYTIPLAGALLPLVDAGMPNEGRVSPESPVTLPQALRRKAMIPRLASSFVWAYPLPGMNGLRGLQMDQNSPVVQFVTFGGFIYLDARGVPLAANALTPGEGLSFVGPYPWTRTIETVEMELSGRMQPITIQALSDTGARYFCWLKPDEDIGLDPAPVHGGFVYLFREPQDEPCADDRYFIIEGSEKQKGQPSSKASAKDNLGSFRANVEGGSRSDMVELPRIEGVKELEGVVVHKRVATAINEVIESDMAVQKVRVGMEPINVSTRVTLHKQRDKVPYYDSAVMSPTRHHMRKPEEFVDVDGGYMGWGTDGIRRPKLKLDYTGEKGFPFPNGISTQLSPMRSRPFFIHSMPSNYRTAFGKSVDGKFFPPTTPAADSPGGGVKNYWVDLYNQGHCGGAKMNLQDEHVRTRKARPTAIPPPDPDMVRVAFGVYGSHAGHECEDELVGVTEEEQKATRYLETIKHELDRQQFSF